MSEPIGPYERVQEKARHDEEFRAALIADPRAAMKDLMGIVVPQTVEISVIENTAQQLNLVLPYIAAEGDLDFEEEDEVVGFGYHNPDFSKDLKMDGPIIHAFHNANFSQNFKPMGDVVSGLRMPKTGK